jgi:hypothetical protein
MLKFRPHPLKRSLHHNVSHAQSVRFTFSEVLCISGHFQGSVFVTDRARAFVDSKYLQFQSFNILISDSDLLRNSRFVDDINNITNSFDRSTKLTFRNMDEPQFMKFGGARDRDPALGIRSGQLKLAG